MTSLEDSSFARIWNPASIQHPRAKKVCRSIADFEIERHKMNEAGKLFQVLYVYYTASA